MTMSTSAAGEKLFDIETATVKQLEIRTGWGVTHILDKA